MVIGIYQNVKRLHGAHHGENRLPQTFLETDNNWAFRAIRDA